MSHPVKDQSIDDIRDQETTMLEDIDHLEYLLECAKVWCTRGLSLKEAYARIENLKIKFAITED